MAEQGRVARSSEPEKTSIKVDHYNEMVKLLEEVSKHTLALENSEELVDLHNAIQLCKSAVVALQSAEVTRAEEREAKENMIIEGRE